jgi:leucyl aminopeptidase
MINFELKTWNMLDVATEKCDALIVLVAQDFKPAKDDISHLLAQSLKAGDFEAVPGKLLTLYRSALVQAPRLVLAGVGEGTDKNVRTALLAAVAAVKGNGLKKLMVCFAAPAQEAAVRAAVLAVAEATYSYTHTKTKKEDRTLQKMVLCCSNASEVQSTFERAAAIVPGIELAKEWANRPANYATPTLLGEAALELARQAKIRCEVLDLDAVTKLGMGAFMAVAQGSDQPLRFIVLRYDGAAKSKAPYVLVGKGITFDSGGISIKPAAEMDEMKFDMSGAASVLGVFRALGQIKPSVNVVGLIPACENLPNGRAVKPGDVITSMGGQTIEVLNTDAEGRLVLCDALTYAERFKPAAVIDIATLTGACVIALGAVRSGLFSPHAELAQALIKAGETAQDLCWQMPLDDEYAEGLKTHFADVANVGGRPAGSVTAAKFLQRFTEKYPWAHLDIAGTAWKGGTAKGATGRPVGLLVEYLVAQATAK